MVARKQILEGGVHVKKDTATQLTAVGTTTAVKVDGLRSHTFQVTVAAINTNVVVQAEGSADGTSFFILPLESTVVSGLAITAHVATITANGTYLLYVKDVAVEEIQFNFVSETGGAAATIDVETLSQS